MDEKTENILNTFKKLGTIGHKDILKMVPLKDRKYKCHTCFSIVNTIPCPSCGETKLEIMCPLDHNDCRHEVSPTIAYCPLCGDPMCPVDGCYNHDCVQLSRITGYYAEVGGWIASKKQELRDRHHYNPVSELKV